MATFQLNDSPVVGAYGTKHDSVGEMDPVYRSDKTYFIGSIQDTTVEASKTWSQLDFYRLVADGKGARLDQAFTVPADCRLVCVTQEIVDWCIELDPRHSEHLKPKPVTSPEGRLLICVQLERLPSLLKWIASILFRMSRIELSAALSCRNADRAASAEQWARVALYRCIPLDDMVHRRMAHERMVASLLLRPELGTRLRTILAIARRDVRTTEMSLLINAQVLLDTLAKPSDVLPKART